MMMPDVSQAVSLLRSGKLVAFPTETVYGLGADASNDEAVQKIFRAKERPYQHPLIVHLASAAQLTEWAYEVPPAAKKLARAFWPGPLTIIFKKQAHVLDSITGGQDTIGLRIPHHPIAHALLRAFGKGIAAPSANKFTHISPTTAHAVQEELGEKVDLVLDGGDCAVGLESTIVDMTQDKPVILRPGFITREQIAAVLAQEVWFRRSSAMTVPGMHHVHYAPVTPVLLLTSAQIPAFLANLTQEERPIAVVTYSHLALPLANELHRVELSADPALYAHALYRSLRTLDKQQFKRIIIEAVPENPQWEAIRDRLNKASGRK